MGRKIANEKLGMLLAATKLGIRDVAVMAGASRRNILRWSCGLPRPVLERKVARIFRVSADELRLLAGLRKKRRGEDERESYNQALEACRRRRVSVCVWRHEDGVGRFVNGGKRLARKYPDGIESLIRIAAGVPRAKVMTDGTGDFWVSSQLPVGRNRKKSVAKKGGKTK